MLGRPSVRAVARIPVRDARRRRRRRHLHRRLRERLLVRVVRGVRRTRRSDASSRTNDRGRRRAIEVRRPDASGVPGVHGHHRSGGHPGMDEPAPRNGSNGGAERLSALGDRGGRRAGLDLRRVAPLVAAARGHCGVPESEPAAAVDRTLSRCPASDRKRKSDPTRIIAGGHRRQTADGPPALPRGRRRSVDPGRGDGVVTPGNHAGGRFGR